MLLAHHPVQPVSRVVPHITPNAAQELLTAVYPGATVIRTEGGVVEFLTSGGKRMQGLLEADGRSFRQLSEIRLVRLHVRWVGSDV